MNINKLCVLLSIQLNSYTCDDQQENLCVYYVIYIIFISRYIPF